MESSPEPECYLQDTRLWEEWTTERPQIETRCDLQDTLILGKRTNERPKKESITDTKRYSLSESLKLINGADLDEASLRNTRTKRLIPYPFTDSQKQESIINSVITIAFVHIFPQKQYSLGDTALKIAKKLQSQMVFPNVDGKGRYTPQWVEERYRQLMASQNEDYVKWCNKASDDKELSDFRTRMNLYSGAGIEWGGV